MPYDAFAEFRMGGHNVIVTGAAQNIGAGIAKILSGAGARVMIADLDGDKAGETAAAIEQETGNRCLGMTCDVTSLADIEALVAATAKAFGGISTLVNNVGWGGRHEDPAAIPEDAFIAAYKLNTISAYRMSMACLPHLLRAENATITNSGSFSSAAPAYDILAYGTAKAALNQMMISLAHMLAKKVRINSVLIGTVMTAGYGSAGIDKAMQEKLRHPDNLTGRPGRPEDVANAMLRSSVRLVFDIDAASPAKPPGPAVSGMLLGEISAFPVLYKDNRSLLTAIVGAGFGGYSDLNAWFGNPQLFNAHNLLAGHLPGKSTAWAEGYAELGLGGASQLWGSPYYAFGALTGLFSWSLGQDIFRDDPRGFLDFEKAYAGLLYVDPENRKNNLKLSIGRQSYTLNDGFLINAVKGSTNAGDRGGLYLGPRLTNDFSVLAQGNSGAWSYNVFYIDPNELEQLESDTTFLGANLKYRFGDDISADATFVTIPTSKSTYANPFGLKLEREGLNTIAGHGLWANAFKLPGVWLEAEAAHQFHPDQDISAWAYYGTVGYIAKSTAWTPSLSYRYAYFSGDDPTTRRYERFDPLLSTGLGVWLQGVSFGKIASNSNLQTQRLQFNVAPNDALNLTLDYYWLHAPELNNLGSNPALATLTSHDLGQEVALSARWSATKSLYVQALVSYAMPGAALRNIGAGSDWTTFQLSLYGGF